MSITVQKSFSHFLSQLALTALTARYERVDRSQINKLIEVLNAYDVDTLLVYMARQVARGEIGRCTARHLMHVIESITRESPADLKGEVRKALGYFKWFFEVFDSMRPRDFEELARKYTNFAVCRDSVLSAPANVYFDLLKSAV
jgi:hypothetical protein